MLNVINRLTKKQDIQFVFKKGRWQDAPFLTIKFLASQGPAPHHAAQDPASRFCFSVSNKVSKLATKRNLIKRRLRHIIRELLPQIKGGYDMVVIVKPEIIKASYQEIKQMLEQVMRRAGLII